MRLNKIGSKLKPLREAKVKWEKLDNEKFKTIGFYIID